MVWSSGFLFIGTKVIRTLHCIKVKSNGVSWLWHSDCHCAFCWLFVSGTFLVPRLSHCVDALCWFPAVNIQWLRVLHVHSLCPHRDLLLSSFFLFTASIFFHLTATLVLTPQLHPCPAILPSTSSCSIILASHSEQTQHQSN